MPAALLVAHGAPADPEPQERALQQLADRVAAQLPGWRIGAATLAMPGALETALERLGPEVLVYPFFMAQGWFTGVELPRRLQRAGGGALRQLPPFGTDPGLPALVARIATSAAQGAGLDPAEATLLLAAHGSKVARGSAEGARVMQQQMQARTAFARVIVGFVEEAPFLQDAATGLGPAAICLPFFALQAGHVTDDVPQALDLAGFVGRRLPAVGQHAESDALIAAALRRAAA